MAEEDKVVNVKFKYTQEGAEQVAQAAKAAREPLWGKTADEYYAKQAKSWDTLGADFLDYQKKYENGTANMEQRTKAFKKEMNELYGEMRGVRYAAMGLTQVGAMLTLGGGVITAGIVAEANNYVKTVGNINDQSNEWLGYQREIKEANLEIGKAAMQSMLPAMEKGAQLMNTIADIVKSNPWIMTAAMGVGSTMLILGTASTLIARLMTIVADIGLAISKIASTQLGQALGMGPKIAGEAGSGMGGMTMTGGPVASGLAFGTVTVTSLVVGSIVGVGVGNFIGELLDKMGIEAFKDYKPQNMADVLVTIQRIFMLPWMGLANVIGSLDPALTGSMNSFKKWMVDLNNTVGNLLGANNVAPTKDTESPITQAEVDAYIAFEKQMADATDNYSNQRAEIIKQTEKQIADATANYEKQRTQVIEQYNKQAARSAEDFAISQARALASYTANVNQSNAQFYLNEQKAIDAYQRQQDKAQKDFNRSQQQMAKDHAKELLRMEMEHNSRMYDLIGQRDALGMVKEQRKYEQELALKTQDQQEARQQAKANFQIQRAEAEQAYKQQRLDAKRAHDLQLADMRRDYEQRKIESEEAYNLQRKRAAEDQADRLNSMAESHKLEMELIQEQEKEKLGKLSDAYKKQVDTIKSAFIDRLRSLDEAIFGDTAAFHNHMKREAINFQNWLTDFKSQMAKTSISTKTSAGGSKSGSTLTPLQQYHLATTGHYQYGGYGIFSGEGETERPEYVMNGDTTQMAENLIGSRLTQSNLLSAIMAGKGGGGSGSGKVIQISVSSPTLTVNQILKHIDSALDMKLGQILSMG